MWPIVTSVNALISCHISVLFLKFQYPLSFSALSFNTTVHSFTAMQNHKKYSEQESNATLLKVAHGTHNSQCDPQ